ncbi:acyl-CoA thioesterase [Spirillospora sp. CA-253888]
MSDLFSVPVTVRGYELDTQGHLNQAVYLQYAEHARWECLKAAGIGVDDLLATGIGPVTLETTVKYRRELRGGDEVEVTCRFEFGEGRTFTIAQQVRKADGTVAAEVSSVCGLLHLAERRLIADPAGHLRPLAADPAVLGA